jgi:hypothetical protein
MGAMAVTRTKVEEFRFLAQECRATALTLSTEQARAEMLPMADVCDRVAAHPTHGNDGPEAGAVSDFHDEIKLSGLIDRGIDWNSLPPPALGKCDHQGVRCRRRHQPSRRWLSLRVPHRR